MKTYLTTSMIGVFAYDEKKNLVSYRFFPKDAEKIAKALSPEMISNEEKQVLEDLKNSGVKEVVSDKKVEYPGLTTLFEKDNLASKTAKEQTRKLAMDLCFVDSQQELNELFSKINIAINQAQLQKPRKDKVLMNVVGIIDELDKTTNTFVERIREWYGLHSPEITRSIQDNEKFAQLVGTYGHREKIKDEKIKVKSFSGMDFEESDVEAIKSISKSISVLYDTRKKLEKYLESVAKETIPNTSAIGGPLLSSRLLQLAGGLDKMARLPSSTIQLLGAEKALFRHLKQGGKPPKFGVLFVHPFIQNAKPEDRGKVARLLAAKLSFAARIDAYSGRDDTARLKKELEEEMQKIK